MVYLGKVGEWSTWGKWGSGLPGESGGVVYLGKVGEWSTWGKWGSGLPGESGGGVYLGQVGEWSTWGKWGSGLPGKVVEVGKGSTNLVNVYVHVFAISYSSTELASGVVSTALQCGTGRCPTDDLQLDMPVRIIIEHSAAMQVGVFLLLQMLLLAVFAAIVVTATVTVVCCMDVNKLCNSGTFGDRRYLKYAVYIFGSAY